MRGPLKALLSDNYLQIAVILSLLRTDLHIYLRQYSRYPEVQQVLSGQSVGLHLVDSYNHNNYYPPLSSTKYVDQTDNIYNEINRLVRSPRQYQHHRTDTSIISAWLFANTTAHSSTSSTSANAENAVENLQADLSSQDIALIESLWKEDLGRGVRQQSCEDKENESSQTNAIVDEDTGTSVGIPDPFTVNDSIDDLVESNLMPSESTGAATSSLPVYNAQSSLEEALQELSPYSEEDSLVHSSGATNSSLLYPDNYNPSQESIWDIPAGANQTGVLWAATDYLPEAPLPRQDSNMNLISEDGDLGTSDFLEMAMLTDEDINMDLNFDPQEILTELYDMRDSISVDSAVSLGNGSPHSWSDGASNTGSERHSVSSSDSVDSEDGAVGYSECKTEPFDNGFFEYEPVAPHSRTKYEKNVVTHDHTYGAPPGGVPHVRKMDMKTEKVPSRGLVHDEAMCKKMKIPFSVDTIINSPMDEFNSLIEFHRLGTKQATLVRDIRRRGKNKVAAQNCREKKNGQLSCLDTELDGLRTKRAALTHRKSVLLNKKAQTKKHIDIMSAEIFSTLRDENGMPYDTTRFSLEIDNNGEIQVTSTDRSSRRSRNNRKGNNGKRKRR